MTEKPNIKRLLAPVMDMLARLLWRYRDFLTAADRDWFRSCVDQLFNARLGR